MVVMIVTRRLPVWISLIENVGGRRRRRSHRGGYVVNLEGVHRTLEGCPSSARAERHIHADSRDAVDYALVNTPSPSRSSTRTGLSQSGHAPPGPRAAQNKLQDSQRRTPTNLSPHWPHS